MRKPVFRVWKQQRRRPACGSTQSGQCLCYSLIGKIHTWTCYKRTFNSLASLCTKQTGFSLVFVPVRKIRKIGFLANEDKYKLSFKPDSITQEWKINLYIFSFYKRHSHQPKMQIALLQCMLVKQWKPGFKFQKNMLLKCWNRFMTKLP